MVAPPHQTRTWAIVSTECGHAIPDGGGSAPRRRDRPRPPPVTVWLSEAPGWLPFFFARDGHPKQASYLRRDVQGTSSLQSGDLPDGRAIAKDSLPHKGIDDHDLQCLDRSRISVRDK
jgi:hypothetical protein